MAQRRRSGLRKPAARRPAPKMRQARVSVWRRHPLLSYGGLTLGLIGLIALIVGAVYWQSLYRGMPELPDDATLWTINRQPAIEFVDAQGVTLAIRGPRYGQAVELSTLPPHVPRAFIAAEDKRFYDHDGADTQAMIRALVSNLASGRTVSGASTLTQQLVKNLVLSPDQTFRRKAQEIRLARQLEHRMSKDEILQLYLNRVYFGAGFYGLGAAARFYFGKTPEDLTLAEASLLATLPQAPSRLALTRTLDPAKKRQAYVLSEMVSAGFITPESARIAAETPITLADPVREDPRLGYLLDLATEQAGQLLANLPDDMVIHLSIDARLQADISTAIDARLEAEGPDAGSGQAAALVFDKTGRLLALYGGRDYRDNQFNRAVSARRQPGSAFKPLIYAAGLESGLSAYDVRIDEAIRIGDWTPNNFDRRHRGPVTLNEAFRASLNTVAAQLGQEVGEDKIIALASRFGITTELRPLPSIALGSQEVSLWELVRAYGPFMTRGHRLDPYVIERITTSRGDVLFDRPAYPPARVYPAESADLMAAMLQGVITQGTGGAAQVDGLALAGKTGTSQSFRDAWFIGFSANTLAGVWTGNDDDAPMSGVTGGGLPARLFGDIMALAHQNRPPGPLPGTGQLLDLTREQERRVAFYRQLSTDFDRFGTQ